MKKRTVEELKSVEWTKQEVIDALERHKDKDGEYIGISIPPQIDGLFVVYSGDKKTIYSNLTLALFGKIVETAQNSGLDVEIKKKYIEQQIQKAGLLLEELYYNYIIRTL